MIELAAERFPGARGVNVCRAGVVPRPVSGVVVVVVTGNAEKAPAV